MQRGRPRHDDVLTPREWEVLELLREGLTNEEIGERLDISFATARFHVSEIISKLGVENRREAADWSGHPKAALGLAPMALLLRRLERLSPGRVAGTTLIAAAVLGLLVLALGVVLMDARLEDGRPVAVQPTSEPEPVTETAVIVYSTPAGVMNRAAGDCWATSFLGRHDTWRCNGPTGRLDPCYGPPGSLEVVCPLGRPSADPADHVILELTEPLTAWVSPGPVVATPPAANDEAPVWWVETADGRMFALKSGGTSGVVNGERLNFYSPDDEQNGLVGMPMPGEVWTARQVQLPLPDPGLGATVPEIIVELRTVWR